MVKKNLADEGLLLKRNERYVDGAPAIQELFLKPVLEDSIRLLELLKGSVDLLQNTIPPALLKKAEGFEETREMIEEM